jgi:hypothetical protein
MPSGSDEIEEGVNTVIAEPWPTLNSTIYGENLVILSLKVVHNLPEAIRAKSTKCAVEVLLAMTGITLPHCQSDRQSQEY